MTTLTEGNSFSGDARAWLQESVPERWRISRGALVEEEKIQIRSEWDRQLFVGGYAGLSIPKEYGGQGLGLREEVLFHELAARAHAPEGIGRVGKILTVPALIRHGSEAQKLKYIPGIMAGTQVWCQAFSEPGAGSDLANMSTFARKVDGGYLVSGQKTWTSFAQYSERAILVAKTSRTAPRHRFVLSGEHADSAAPFKYLALYWIQDDKLAEAQAAIAWQRAERGAAVAAGRQPVIPKLDVFAGETQAWFFSKISDKYAADDSDVTED